MSELSREQVEDRIDEICDECIAQDAPGYVQELKDTDADLRVKLEEQTKRADAAEEKWHRAATHDSSIDEAEAIHELTVKVEALTAELDNYRSIAEREGASIAVSQLAAMTQRSREHLERGDALLKERCDLVVERDQLQATVTAQQERIVVLEEALREAGEWVSDTINGSSFESCDDPVVRKMKRILTDNTGERG